jgi:hypothetical protein
LIRPSVTGDRALARRWRNIGYGKGRAARPLHAFGFGQAEFALLPKDRALKPGDLTAQIDDLAFLFADQFDQFWRRERSGCGRRRVALIETGGHVEMLPRIMPS